MKALVAASLLRDYINRSGPIPTIRVSTQTSTRRYGPPRYAIRAYEVRQSARDATKFVHKPIMSYYKNLHIMDSQTAALRRCYELGIRDKRIPLQGLVLDPDAIIFLWANIHKLGGPYAYTSAAVGAEIPAVAGGTGDSGESSVIVAGVQESDGIE